MCRKYIERAKGAIVTLVTARHQQRTACDAASARRFRNGVRCTQVVPYTAGPAALRLASCVPGLRQLSLHEATSCLGGMTDEFAAAVAAHCPLLSSLEVAFTRYSLPSEFFTDAGMMALAAGCPRLTSLSLTNCGAITDRSLYAVAAHCCGLSSLALGGYHELITDYGTVVLFQACTSLESVVLSGKLRRVTDDSAEALAAGSGATLREVKLTRSMGDRALAAFTTHCRALRLVDCCKCESSAVTAAGVAALLRKLSSPPTAPATKPHQQHQAQQPAQPASGVATADTGAIPAAPPPPPPPLICGRTSTSARSDTVRVLLPPGVRAADVVQLAPEGGRRWQAVTPAAAPPPPSPLSYCMASSVAMSARSSAPASASSSPLSSLSCSPSSPGASSPSVSASAAHMWTVSGGRAAAAAVGVAAGAGSGTASAGGLKAPPAPPGGHYHHQHSGNYNYQLQQQQQPQQHPAGMPAPRCPPSAEALVEEVRVTL